jgi:hypothetical protein
MPIRFRCAYCNQLMAIARRKAGTVVRCPTCSGQVVVPATEPPQGNGPGAVPGPAGGGVFERSDFEQVFQNAPVPVPAPAPAPSTQGPGFALGPEPASVQAPSDFDVQPVPLTVPGSAAFLRRPEGLVLTPARGVLLTLIVVVLLALAFLAGFLVGQSA